MAFTRIYKIFPLTNEQKKEEEKLASEAQKNLKEWTIKEVKKQTLEDEKSQNVRRKKPTLIRTQGPWRVSKGAPRRRDIVNRSVTRICGKGAPITEKPTTGRENGGGDGCRGGNGAK